MIVNYVGRAESAGNEGPRSLVLIRLGRFFVFFPLIRADAEEAAPGNKQGMLFFRVGREKQKAKKKTATAAFPPPLLSRRSLRRRFGKVCQAFKALIYCPSQHARLITF